MYKFRKTHSWHAHSSKKNVPTIPGKSFRHQEMCSDVLHQRPFQLFNSLEHTLDVVKLFTKKQCQTNCQNYERCLPAKQLCDASGVLVSVWLLITSCYQPSLLSSNAACSTPQRRAECVSLSLPVHSLSTARPMQCLLMATGVSGCREAPKTKRKLVVSVLAITLLCRYLLMRGAQYCRFV